jgi:hypothetical protein
MRDKRDDMMDALTSLNVRGKSAQSLQEEDKASQVYELREAVLRNSQVLFHAVEEQDSKRRAHKRLTARGTFVNTLKMGTFKQKSIDYSKRKSVVRANVRQNMSNEDKRKEADVIAAKSFLEMQTFSLKYHHWYIINPTTIKLQIWDWIVWFLIVFQSLWLPYEIAFLTGDEETWMSVSGYLIQMVFVTDLVACFFKSYENMRGEIVFDLPSIRTHYLKFWFWVDFPSALPLTLIFGSSVNAPRFLNVVKLLRVVHLMFGAKRLSNRLKILRLIFGFALLAHYLGCLWYVTVAPGIDEGLDVEDDLGFEEMGSRLLLSADINATARLDGDFYQPWLKTNLLHTNKTNARNIYRWIVSAYSGLAMLLGENLVPVEPLEFALHSLALLCGAILQAYIFGQVALLIADQNSTSVKWKHKMGNVMAMMKALQLPKDLQIRIQNYYEYYWHRHRGIDHSLVFDDLSSPLLSEISLCMHADHVQKVPFFRGCTPHFLVRVVQKLHPQIFMPGDYIIVKGQYGREMYFIRRGECKVLNDDNGVICTLTDGQSFGEVALYGKSQRRTATVISSAYCDLDTLFKTDFTALVEEFPDMQEKIAEKAIQTALGFKEQISDKDMNRIKRFAGKVPSPDRNNASLRKVHISTCISPVSVPFRSFHSQFPSPPYCSLYSSICIALLHL